MLELLLTDPLFLILFLILIVVAFILYVVTLVNINRKFSEPKAKVSSSKADSLVSKVELEAKLFETEPGSKEREIILKQLDELDGR